MPDEFRTEVETQELMDQLWRNIFIITEGHQREQQNFQILVTLNHDFQMKYRAHRDSPMFAIDPNSTIHGWPYLTDVKQKEPYKVWSRYL